MTLTSLYQKEGGRRKAPQTRLVASRPIVQKRPLQRADSKAGKLRSRRGSGRSDEKLTIGGSDRGSAGRSGSCPTNGGGKDSGTVIDDIDVVRGSRIGNQIVDKGPEGGVNGKSEELRSRSSRAGEQFRGGDSKRRTARRGSSAAPDNWSKDASSIVREIQKI